MSVRYMQQQTLRAAREGRAIHKFKDEDATVTAGFVVSTLASIYYDIPAGKQVIVDTVHYGINTVDDEITVYMVACAEITAGGAATQKMHHFFASSGTKKEGNGIVIAYLATPLCIKYSDGHRSVSMAVKATDTDAIATYGWCGYFEDEGTLS